MIFDTHSREKQQQTARTTRKKQQQADICAYVHTSD